MIFAVMFLFLQNLYLGADEQQKSDYLFEENFLTLENWKPLTFPKIREHSLYSIVRDRDNSYLQIASNSSASAIVHNQVFDVKEWPVLEWRWKAMNIFRKGNALEKSGDDYPVRIYVIFEFDPDNAGILKKTRYNMAKLFYGEYPPDSALNYVWASTAWQKHILPNAFTDRAMMIAKDSGSRHLGEWRTHKVNIFEDYKAAFGTDPPLKAGIAVMGDSDNTGESSTAFIDYIRILKE